MILTGRLGAEPELTATSSGQEVVRYSIGTSYGPRDNRQTSWFRVGAFLPEGAQRDYIMSLPKGTLVYLEGDASMRSYENADGQKQTNLNIVQRSLEVLTRPQQHGNDQ
ncbi:ssDNA-binding protein mitochondrial [Penicillium atrosanguineum]|nr:ssDNA-binding protein mitochondrial [Penicillium atrosanguineum]